VELHLGEGRLFHDITLGRAVNHVTHLETLHSLVLWHTTAAIHAADDRSVATTVLRTTIVAALGGHGKKRDNNPKAKQRVEQNLS
jgi:hypothetical protein